jgi:hypothetical protein
MARRAVALGIMFAILGSSTIAILLFSFQVRNLDFAVAEETATSEITINSEPDNSVAAIPPVIDTENSDETQDIEPEITLIVHQKPTYDGRISREEYAFGKQIEDFGMGLYWNIDEVEGMIYFALFSDRRDGCVGIALNPAGLRIGNADILSGFVEIEEGTAVLQFRDDYASEETSHSSDVALAGEFEEEEGNETRFNNIIDQFGRTNAIGTVMEFSRQLDTGDVAYDQSIERDRMPMAIQLGYSLEKDYSCFVEDGNIIALEIDFFENIILREEEEVPQS